jgi:hypothetical protein
MSNECEISNFKTVCYLNFEFDLSFAMNHVRFMISPELYVIQETLAFDISTSGFPPLRV